MVSVEQHYASLLAPIYLWQAGGIDAALAQGAEEVAPFPVTGGATPVAIDLGAGFGMHAIPLARNGYAVTAIDSSELLLAELRRHARGLDVRTVQADLRQFPDHVAARADLVVCLGDTLTHLPQWLEVERLLVRIAAALAPGGRFVATFRDYTQPLAGDARFVPVRSSANRIHTCFLEPAGARMVVTDLVHERAATAWRLRTSSYAKLRLSPVWLVAALERVGLRATVDTTPRGMVRIVAMAA
jgi:SAM-dependent methyltransferase